MRMTGKVKGEIFLKNIMQFEPIYCFSNKVLGKHFEYSVLASENWEELTKIWLYWLMQLKFLNKKIFEKMKFFLPSREADYMTDKSHHLCQKLTFLVVSFLLILVPLWLFLLFSPLLCRFLLLQHLNYCDTCNLLEIKLIQILVFLKHCGWLVCWLDLLVISAVIINLMHVWWFFPLWLAGTW